MTSFSTESAARLLGVSAGADEHHLWDAYMAKCFEVRQRVLRTAIVPRLLLKRGDDLWRLHDAYRALVPDKTEVLPQRPANFQWDLPEREAATSLQVAATASLQAQLSAFQQQEAATKLQLMQAQFGPAMCVALWALAGVQHAWETLWLLQTKPALELALKQDEPVVNNSVKAADVTYPVELTNSLKALNVTAENSAQQLVAWVNQATRTDEQTQALTVVLTESLRIRNLHSLGR